MARGDKYHVLEFRNPTVDSDVHYMTIALEDGYDICAILRTLKIGRPQLEFITDKKLPVFNSKAEADAEGKRLGAVASQINPDRVSAEQHFPGDPSKMVEAGTPGVTT